MGSRQATKGWGLTSKGQVGDGEAEALRRRGRQAGSKEEATRGLLSAVEGIRRAHTHNRHKKKKLCVAGREMEAEWREGSEGKRKELVVVVVDVDFARNRKISEGPESAGR